MAILTQRTLVFAETAEEPLAFSADFSVSSCGEKFPTSLRHASKSQ